MGERTSPRMSKMRLSSAALLMLAGLTLGSCAHQAKASDPNVRGIGYVRLQDALKNHPLYPQLAQIDDSIDALSLKNFGGATVPHSGAQIAAETKELNQELRAAQDRANSILRQKQADYQRREQQAISAALAAAGAGTNGAQAAASMQDTSAAQAQQVTAQANADFEAYQKEVVARDNAASSAIAAQLNARADQAYHQRATQLQERESQLALDLSQQDAAKRLDLRTKLNNLALDDATRKAYRSQLAQIDASEAEAVAQQRSRDQQDLAAYHRQLQSRTATQIAAATAKIHSDTQAKLQSRRNEVSQQVASNLQALSPASVPSNLSASTRDRIAQIEQQFKSQFAADAQKTVAQYQATKADLDARYAALQGVDTAAGGAAGKQIAQLRKQRDDLYTRMVNQIRHDADGVAAKRGLSVVFVNYEAAPGGIDLTDDVSKEIESVHE